MKRPDGRTTIIVLLVAVLLLVPALYVLSAGPAVYLFKNGFLSEGVVHTVYWPLQSLYEVSPTFASFMEWYEEIWSP